MAANNLGTAYIKIAPQMQGIQKSISDGLAGIKSSSIPGAAAVGTIVAKGVSAAMNLVTSSVDGAIRRTDILNNFPKVMANLGISAKDAQKAIDKLNKGLDGLPTTLQDGASAVQRFTSKNNDVKKSTDIFLALNNAILAGGAPTEQQATALEQLSQAYAKGKPDMMEWRSAYSAMPAQLNQVAEAMGLGKNAADKLGEQLRSGKISMDDFMNAIVRLNSKGVGNFASFEKQARDASGGIGTAMTNLSSRAQKAVGTIIQAFGSKNLSDTINKFSSSFSGIADWIAKNIVPVIKNTLIPTIKAALQAIKSVVEFIAQNRWVQTTLMGLLNTIIAYKAVKTVTGIVGDFGKGIADLGKNVAQNATSIGKFVSSLVEAKTAGFTLGESFEYAKLSTTGLGQKIAETGVQATSTVSKMSSLSKSLIAMGTVVAVVVGVQMAITAFQTACISATTATRDFERAHYNLSMAANDARESIERQKQAVQDLNDSELAAADAEIELIQAKRDIKTWQEEVNRLEKEGKTNTDDYTEAKARLRRATAEQANAQKTLAQANKEVADSKKKLDDANSTQLYIANKAIAATMREKGEYGNLALQLDKLSKATVTYKDEHGNMVTAVDKKSKEMAVGIAEQLANSRDETGAIWRQIVDIANNEGISFAEAAKRYGAQAGSEVTGNFKATADAGLPLMAQAGDNMQATIRSSVAKMINDGSNGGKNFVSRMALAMLGEKPQATNAGKSTAQAAVNGAKSVKGMYDVGKNLALGLFNGIKDSGAVSKVMNAMIANVNKTIQAAKDAGKIKSPSRATAEIGKFLSLGLAKGINDYAEEAVIASENLMDSTIGAMDGSMNRLQPQTALTGAQNGSGGQVIQYNDFTVDSELDVKEISKRLGWQVATAL